MHLPREFDEENEHPACRTRHGDSEAGTNRTTDTTNLTTERTKCHHLARVPRSSIFSSSSAECSPNRVRTSAVPGGGGNAARASRTSIGSVVSHDGTVWAGAGEEDRGGE